MNKQYIINCRIISVIISMHQFNRIFQVEFIGFLDLKSPFCQIFKYTLFCKCSSFLKFAIFFNSIHYHAHKVKCEAFPSIWYLYVFIEYLCYIAFIIYASLTYILIVEFIEICIACVSRGHL